MNVQWEQPEALERVQWGLLKCGQEVRGPGANGIVFEVEHAGIRKRRRGGMIFMQLGDGEAHEATLTRWIDSEKSLFEQ